MIQSNQPAMSRNIAIFDSMQKSICRGQIHKTESTPIPGNIANDKTIDLKILSMHTETLYAYCKICKY